MARTFLLILCGLLCAQLLAAQPHRPGEQSLPQGQVDDLLEQLMHGRPQERVLAQYRAVEMGWALSPYLQAKRTLKRPTLAQSFAARFRAYLLGDGEIEDTLRLLQSCGSSDPRSPKPDLRQFAAWSKNVGNAADLLNRLTTYPQVAGASQENTDALVKLLSIPDEKLQLDALSALARFSSFKVPADLIVPFLKSPSLPVFLESARILARQNSDAAADALIARLRPEPLSRAGLLAPAFADGDPVALGPKLRELLQDPDPRMQTVAAGFLMALNDGKDAAEAKLLELLDTKNPDVRINAAWVLYEFGTDKSKDGVREKLNKAKDELAKVYLGCETWLPAETDGTKRAQAHLTVNHGTPGTGIWAIDLRDALRVGLTASVKAQVQGYAQVLVQEFGVMSTWQKQPIAVRKKESFKLRNPDRYTYSIFATILSELDPDSYKKEIQFCVAAITSRQLGCGLWSYRDPTPKEQEDFGDGYDAAAATDYEFPQAFYALAGLDSAITFADVKVDPVVFLRALRGLLYCQYLDGSFTNYAQHSPYPEGQLAFTSTQHTAWGLAMLAICLRQGKSVLADEPDVLARGFIARQAAYTHLRERVLTETANAHNPSALFPLRELAFSFGNAGLLANADRMLFDTAFLHQNQNPGQPAYEFGLPEPADSTTPPWEPSTDIEIRSSVKK